MAFTINFFSLGHDTKIIFDLNDQGQMRFFYLIIVTLFLSCNSGEEKKTGPVARVYDQHLYADDLKGVVPKGTPEDDSIKLVDKFINSWIREKLLIKKAESNLTDEQKNVEKQLETYRNSLIIYSYEKELIGQQLDTTVAADEIAGYYESNKNSFELRDNIIKVLYVKVSKKAPDLDKIKRWYGSDIPKDRASLETYCHQYAQNFYLDDNTWLLFDDILKEIPIETYNKELFLKNNRLVQVEDSSSLYLLNIKGFKIKNSISPLAFEKENIRNIILNKRKLELVNRMNKDIYEEAVKNNEVEIIKTNE